MINTRLIYIVTGYSSAFESQVIQLLNEIAQSQEQFNEIILLCPDKRTGTKLNGLCNQVKTIFYTKLPDYPLLNYFTIASIKKTLLKLPKTDFTLVHARSELAGWQSLIALGEAGNIKYLFDIRGALLEEIYFFSRINKISRILKTFLMNSIHKRLWKKPLYFNVVSPKLKEYIIHNWKINKDRISVISCIAGKNFNYNNDHYHLREHLGIQKNEFLIVFLTGNAESKWQNTTIISQLNLPPNSKILFLGKDSVSSEGKIICRKVSYNEVANYLSIADAALILREKNVVNDVAAPIKFSEYLSCGLPVIANDNVSLVSDLIRKHKLGKVIHSLDEINTELIDELRSVDREKVASFGKMHFGVSSISENYLALYNIILSS